MLMFEWILVLLLAAVILTNLAERLAVPYPSLLAIAGVGLAFLPFAPQIRIEPELALALFVAPALLDAAFDTSPRDLRRNTDAARGHPRLGSGYLGKVARRERPRRS
jgi:monovalent cation/hydrogen antiporter